MMMSFHPEPTAVIMREVPPTFELSGWDNCVKRATWFNENRDMTKSYYKCTKTSKDLE